MTTAPKLPEGLEPVALRMALAHIRWTSFGECRTPGCEGPPPTAADTVEAIEAALLALAADTARLDWLDKNPGRIKHSIGYRGTPDSWVYTDAKGYGHDAENLRAAIDSALLAEKEAK